MLQSKLSEVVHSIASHPNMLDSKVASACPRIEQGFTHLKSMNHSPDSHHPLSFLQHLCQQ